MNQPQTQWNSQIGTKADRLARAAALARGKLVKHEDATALLERVLGPGDRVCLEGNNQKQADFLADALAGVDPRIVHDLHMVQSASRCRRMSNCSKEASPGEIDFSFSGPQAHGSPGWWRKIASASTPSIPISSCSPAISSISTPQVALMAAEAADREGNLYTGPNTEETPTMVEATAFKGGVVVAQVNELRRQACRASTCPVIGWTSSSVGQAVIYSSRCSPAIPAPSPRPRS